MRLYSICKTVLNFIHIGLLYQQFIFQRNKNPGWVWFFKQDFFVVWIITDQETWVDCSHGVENEQNVHQEFKWCDSSTVTLTSILIWVANWKVWREHGQNLFLKQCYFKHPRLNLYKFRNYASLIVFILIRS